MGNYHQPRIDFIKRTLDLIEQYDSIKEQYPFEQQYNHTLLINCLLGLIVLPKEKAITFIPKTKGELLESLNQYGIINSEINENINDTKVLFERLRNAIAHFDIEFISETDEFLIDKIKFRDSEANLDVVTFTSNEFPIFVKYYANQIILNLEKYG
ncbi:MAG: HEPN family nuclease [Bergeyella sp.]